MSKCINCTWYPWKPGTDLSLLPVMKCHPDLPTKKWSKETATTEHECQKFKAATKDDHDAETKNQAKETSKRNNTGKKK